MPGLQRTYPDLFFNFIKCRGLSPPLNCPCPADLLAVKSDSAAEPSNISAPQLFTDLNCEMPEDSGVESSVQRICPWQRVRPCGARLGLSHLCSFSQLQPLSSPSVIFHLQSQSSLIGLILHLVTVFNKKVLFKEKIFISLQLWYVCGRNDCVTIVSSVVWEIESTKWEWHQINKCPSEVSFYWVQCFVKAILLDVIIWNKLFHVFQWIIGSDCRDCWWQSHWRSHKGAERSPGCIGHDKSPTSCPWPHSLTQASAVIELLIIGSDYH